MHEKTYQVTYWDWLRLLRALFLCTWRKTEPLIHTRNHHPFLSDSLPPSKPGFNSIFNSPISSLADYFNLKVVDTTWRRYAVRGTHWCCVLVVFTTTCTWIRMHMIVCTHVHAHLHGHAHTHTHLCNAHVGYCVTVQCKRTCLCHSSPEVVESLSHPQEGTAQTNGWVWCLPLP